MALFGDEFEEIDTITAALQEIPIYIHSPFYLYK
jgi:hypothetical protein